MIQSSHNSQIKKVIQLKKSAKFRRKSGLFVVEGWKMTQEAIMAGGVEQLFVAQSEESKLRRKLSQEAFGIEIVSDNVFELISDTKTPQGVLAAVNMPVYDKKEYLSKENVSLLCLEDINDPGNLGTMLRTAEGAGFTGFILSKETVDLFNPKVVRATMGSLFRVPFFIAEDFLDDIKKLKESKFTLYAAHLQGECVYHEEKYRGNIAVLIGNEANGLSNEVSELADVRLKIPMEGKLESLNAAVCASILMYEIYKQRY